MTQQHKLEYKKNIKQKSIVWWLYMTSSLVILIFLMVFSITKGTTQIPLHTVYDSFINFDKNNSLHLIVIDLRLPRVIASAMVGAALAVAGAIMQGITRNPMADSGLMGLNAGASFALSICFAFFPTMMYIHDILFCFLGASFGAILVNGISSFKKGGASPTRLVLAGAAVSALLVALSQGIALYFGVSQSIMFWTAGGVVGSNWQQIFIVAPLIVITLILSILLSRSVSLLSLGQDVAKGLGLNTGLVSAICSLIVVVLAGTAVSIVGSISFVGLVVPHLARFVVGVDYKRIIPTSLIFGALLVVLADLVSRTINPPFETPLGAIISLIGVPFFLYLSRKQRRAI